MYSITNLQGTLKIRFFEKKTNHMHHDINAIGMLKEIKNCRTRKQNTIKVSSSYYTIQGTNSTKTLRTNEALSGHKATKNIY